VLFRSKEKKIEKGETKKLKWAAVSM
jgi:hypothetical protein